jgi:hypothetical protein
MQTPRADLGLQRSEDGLVCPVADISERVLPGPHGGLSLGALGLLGSERLPVRGKVSEHRSIRGQGAPG